VGDDGDVAEIHGSSSKFGQWLERDLAGKPGPTFPDRAQNLEFEGALAPKKEARPKDRAHLTRCGAIYSEIAEKQWVIRPSANDLLARNPSQLGILPDIRVRTNGSGCHGDEKSGQP
jgi:hypothetical protein